MPDALCEISRDQLLAHAAEGGVELTAHQLVRWHKAGLLPRPRREHLGRSKGTRSVYPIEAVEQAVALASALKEERDLESAAWRVWLAGYPVTSRIRVHLLRDLDEGISVAQTALQQFDDEDSTNPIDNAPYRLLTRSFGRFPRDSASTLALIFCNAMLGRLPISGFTEKDFIRVMPRIARVHRKHGAQEHLELSQLIALITGEANLPGIRETIAILSDRQLERARDELMAMWRFPVRFGVAPRPVPAGALLAWVALTRVSSKGRLFVSAVRRMLRDAGPGMFEQYPQGTLQEQVSSRSHPAEP